MFKRHGLEGGIMEKMVRWTEESGAPVEEGVRVQDRDARVSKEGANATNRNIGQKKEGTGGDGGVCGRVDCPPDCSGNATSVWGGAGEGAARPCGGVRVEGGSKQGVLKVGRSVMGGVGDGDCDRRGEAVGSDREAGEEGLQGVGV